MSQPKNIAINKKRYVQSSVAGFTLLELLMTMALAAILLGLAVPSFRTLILNNQMTANVNDVVSALYLARSEAIRRDITVSLCVSNDAGDNCSADASDEIHDNGWLMISDNGVRGTIDGDDAIIQVYPPIDNDNFSITYSGDEGRVTFNSLGFTSGVTNRTLSFCDVRGNNNDAPRNVVISATGRVRTEHPSTPNC